MFHEPEVTAVDQAETTPNLPGIQLPPAPPKHVNTDVPKEPEAIAVKQVETIPHLSEIQHPKQSLRARPKSQQAIAAQPLSSETVGQSSAIRKVKPKIAECRFSSGIQNFGANPPAKCPRANNSRHK